MLELLFEDVIQKNEIVLSDYVFVKPTAIALLSLKAKNKQVTISSFEGPVSTFLSRIGFFKFTGINDPHSITAYDNIKTIELDNHFNLDEVNRKINRLISNNIHQRTLEIIILESSANIDQHSESSGLVVGQVINNKVNICIADDGIGIWNSLKKVFPLLKEEVAMKISCQQNVTDGNGRGLGLWSISETLKRNGGDLRIGSGNYIYDSTRDRLLKIPFYKGTFVNIRYDLRNITDYTEVTGLASSYAPF